MPDDVWRTTGDAIDARWPRPLEGHSFMSTTALRQAWAEWRSFADGLDLSDGSPDCAVLHARLFRLSGTVPLRASALRAAREEARSAFGPWLEEKGAAGPNSLEQLRIALAACEPGWRALVGGPGRGGAVRAHLERVALSAGLAWPAGPFWASPLHVAGQRFDFLRTFRGRDHAASLALLGALLRVLDHPRGAPLFEWARETSVLRRPAEALHASALFRDAYEAGALLPEWLAPLGWGPLAESLVRLCEDVALRFLACLNEPLPAPALPTAPRARRPAPHRLPVPETLPIEPWFREVPGCEPFLRAAAEEPLEDDHRLALADWLEERGLDDRAQFIRLQCELERLPEHPLARRLLAERATALFEANVAAWTAGLPRQDRIRWAETSNFRRGLLEHLTFEHAPELVLIASEAINVRGLRTALYGPNCPVEQAGAKGLLARPSSPSLVSLDLVSAYEADLPPLVNSPVLAGLVHLGLIGHQVTASGARALAEAFRLPAMSSLSFLSGPGADELCSAAAGSMARNLRRLRIQGASPAGIRTLASSPGLAGLEHLELSAGRYSSGGEVEPLASSPFLGNLSTLILTDVPIGAKSARALASSPNLKRLHCLGLRSARLRDEGVRALARSSNLANLSVLDLGGHRQLGESGIRALAGSPHLANLRALSLSGASVNVAGAKALAESPHLAGLEALELSNVGLDGPAARALVRGPGLSGLRLLNLRDNHLPPAVKGAVHKRWPFALL